MKRNIFVETVLIFLIVVSQTVLVKPFNISADSSRPFYNTYLSSGEKILINESSTNQIGPSDTSESVFYSGFLKNYSSNNYTLVFAGVSENSFKNILYQSDGSVLGYQNSETINLNGNTYNIVYNSGNTFYIPVNYNSQFPLIGSSDYNIAKGGFLYEYLKNSNNFNVVQPLTYVQANSSFPSWYNSPTNPYLIDCSSDFYIIGSNNLYVYIFPLDPNATISVTRGNDSINPSRNTTSLFGNNLTYFVITAWSYSSSYNYSFNINQGSNMNNTDIPFMLYYDQVYNVPDPIQRGNLVASFYTRFAGSGSNENINTWRENVDVIQWDNIDSLGYDIGNYGLIEIRAVPGEYIDNNKNGLIVKTIQDFVLDTANIYSFGYFNPYDMEFNRKWSDMNNHFTNNIPGFSIFNYYLDELWHKNGWIWQVRIVDKEDTSIPITEWQTIYNTTSYTGNDIFNNPNFDPDLVNTIQEINTTNNTNNNYYNNTNWYINNTTINMSNPDGTDTTDKPWWSYLLEGILSLLEKIVDAVGGLFSDIIKGIFDLISNIGINILDTFTDLWNGFLDIFNDIDFNNDNPDYDIGLPENTDEVIDIIPAFLRGLNRSGLMWMIWIPLVFSIIKIIT